MPVFFQVYSPFYQPYTDGWKPFVPGLSRGFSGSKDVALAKAVGECLERVPFLYYRNSEFITSTAGELAEHNVAHVTPKSTYTEAQEHIIGRPKLTTESRFRWATCEKQTATRGETELALVPAQYLYWRYFALPDEPMLREYSTHGYAAYYSAEEARRRALLEWFERDGFFMHWLWGVAPKRVSIESLQRTSLQASLVDTLKCVDDIYILDVTAPDTNIPTFFCILQNKPGQFPCFSAGASIHADPVVAIQGALEEAVSALHWLRFNKRSYRAPSNFPYQAEYNDHDRLNFWADEQNSAQLEWFLVGEQYSLSYFTERYQTADDTLAALLDTTQALDFDIYWHERSLPALQGDRVLYH